MGDTRMRTADFEVPVRINPNSITFYDSNGNCIHMKKEFGLAALEGDSYAVSYNGGHLFNVGAKFADDFVQRYSQASNMIEHGLREGRASPEAISAYRCMLYDFTSKVSGHLAPIQPDPTQIKSESSVFHFGAEVAALQKIGKGNSLHFGPADTLHVALSPNKAEEKRAELMRLNSDFKRVNIAMRKALSENKGTELAVVDFRRALCNYAEFKNKLVVDAAHHGQIANAGGKKQPEMKIISLH